jgi:hypothetical protein
MSDNEHATAALGDSEVSSVKDPVGPPIPEVFQRPKDGSHVSSFVRRQQSIDVLEENPLRSEFSSEIHKRMEEPCAASSESSTIASQGNVLAWESSDEEIDSSGLFDIDPPDVIEHRHLRPVTHQHSLRVWVDLAHECEFMTSPLQPEVESTTSREG